MFVTFKYFWNNWSCKKNVSPLWYLVKTRDPQWLPDLMIGYVKRWMRNFLVLHPHTGGVRTVLRTPFAVSAIRQSLATSPVPVCPHTHWEILMLTMAHVRTPLYLRVSQAFLWLIYFHSTLHSNVCFSLFLSLTLAYLLKGSPKFRKIVCCM